MRGPKAHITAAWTFFVAVIAILCHVFSPSSAAAGESQPAPVEWPDDILIVAGPAGGQWSALGEALAGILTREGIPTRSKVGGGVENLVMVGEEKADIGFTLYSFLGAAAAGEESLAGADLGNIALMANVYPQILYIIVRKEVADAHDLKRLGDLLKITEPIRFGTLPKDTGSEFIFNTLLRSAYRTDYDQLAEQGWDIGFMSYADITARFLAGELDVCAYTAGPGTYLIPALERERLDAVLLPIDDDKLSIMTHQYMTITYVIEKGDYQSIREDVATLGDYSCLVVRRSMPEDLVYRINKILWENKSALTGVSKDIDNLSPRIAVAGLSRAHPGSVLFWTSPEMLRLKKTRKN